MSKKYTLEQIGEIVERQGWSFTTCQNERDGQECEGVDTIQVAITDDTEYFGEFVGNNNEFEFILYTI